MCTKAKARALRLGSATPVPDWNSIPRLRRSSGHAPGSGVRRRVLSVCHCAGTLETLLDPPAQPTDTAWAMSEENVEVVRRNTAAFSRGDFDGFMEDWAPDAVVDWSNSRGPDAGVYRGHGEVRAFAQRFSEAFEEIRIELVDDPVEVKDGLVLAENVTYLRGRDGIEVQARSAWLITFRDGEQTSLTLYQTKRQALEAAGLSE
jgi:ketosteroid isomerase-like protein